MSQMKGRFRSLRCVVAQALLVCMLALIAGCVTTQSLGDRAYRSEEYSLALEYYEQAIAEGSRDPELYYRAARASTNVGSFSQAERYYSRSLRHGGGVRVARSLAQLYVQTSNFAQAVRVYQYLMRVEEDVQPVYSNMGAALMYSGRYLDAESFMIIAQQMKPSDPVPYINLGVLYDRHIRNRPRAVAFYQCFTELTPDVSQRRQVENRMLEMANEGPIDASRVGLKCGEIYRLPEPTAVDLGDALKDYGGEVDLGFEVEAGQQDDAEIEIQRTAPPEGRLDDVRRVEEGSEMAPEASQASENTPGDVANGRDDEAAVALPETAAGGAEDESAPVKDAEEVALNLYEDGRYDDALRTLRSIDGRSEQGDRAFGLALYRTGRFEEAAEWLELTLERLPSPEVTGALVDAYRRLGRRDALLTVCERFEGWPDYESALQRCPDAPLQID
ncbi:tetratricopeptide repeat protein [Lujinxingia sediminis]|uniref:Tetratricopeptide repeat protein n=2 Tax=Lujinxingia sediminis TaxID=2480984 RepID=A0ABY0CVU6_9DELT|nr:tetratricopeptide repeat protein [Lujinxingia sediminis]